MLITSASSQLFILFFTPSLSVTLLSSSEKLGSHDPSYICLIGQSQNTHKVVSNVHPYACKKTNILIQCCVSVQFFWSLILGYILYTIIQSYLSQFGLFLIHLSGVTLFLMSFLSSLLLFPPCLFRFLMAIDLRSFRIIPLVFLFICTMQQKHIFSYFSSLHITSTYLHINYFKDCIHLLERERQHEKGRDRGRGRSRLSTEEGA